MNRKFNSKILLTLLLFLSLAGVCAGQTANSSNSTKVQEVPQDSLYSADGALKVLPPYTDSLKAWQNRAPRHIAQGYYIIIQKSTHKLHLYKNGVLLKSYPVGTGKNPKDKTKENDMTTPEGHFNLIGIYASSTWRYTSPITGKKSGPGVYGPWFFSVNTSKGSFSSGSWSGIGIHGTSSPSSVGYNVSHGCIRLYSKDITAIRDEVSGSPMPPKSEWIS